MITSDSPGNHEGLATPLHALATFAVGKADVTIINISGETPGDDIKDILQTAVHALITMKRTDMKLSCHFVCQQVAAVDDGSLRIDRQNFQSSLRQMILDTAKVENFEDRCHSLQENIQFSETYFPTLWKGNPPMAPTNPDYIRQAKALKQVLMNHPKAQAGDTKFQEFQQTIEQLWIAVCNENYIFSFKNTLEVIAHNELDANFSEWSWLLHRKMIEWQLETANIIKNTSTNEELDQAEEKQLDKANAKLEKIFTEMKKAMDGFFETSDYSRTLVQWRERYGKRLENLKEDSKKEAKKICELLIITKRN